MSVVCKHIDKELNSLSCFINIPDWNDSTPQKERAMTLWKMAHDLSEEYNLN